MVRARFPHLRLPSLPNRPPPPRRPPLSRAVHRRGHPSEGATLRARLSRCSPRSSSAPHRPRAVDSSESRLGPSHPLATTPWGLEPCSPRICPRRTFKQSACDSVAAPVPIRPPSVERGTLPPLYCQTEYVHAPVCSQSLCHVSCTSGRSVCLRRRLVFQGKL